MSGKARVNGPYYIQMAEAGSDKGIEKLLQYCQHLIKGCILGTRSLFLSIIKYYVLTDFNM